MDCSILKLALVEFSRITLIIRKKRIKSLKIEYSSEKEMKMTKNIKRWFVKTSPARLLVVGFGLVMLIGGFLLWLPISRNPGTEVSFFDSLFEAVSAVCVTGLTVVPVGQTYNFFGRLVLAVLIQIGGMGIVLLGIGLILLAGGKLGFKTRSLFIQAQNLMGYSEILKMARKILWVMFGIELAGALLCWPIFMENYDPWSALGFACFHSISAFNNAGFDILGGYDSLTMYADNIPMVTVTSFLVISGGFGFIALIDLFKQKFHWRSLLLNTKIVIVMTLSLLIGGTIIFKLTTDQTWLEAWFQSVIARTAGFATYPLANFSHSAILIFTILMFIGASPNSTGGGVKTTTVFVAAVKAFSSSAEHDEDSVFYRRIPDLVFSKAFVVLFFGMCVVLCGSFLVMIGNPQADMDQVLVEVTSAFATVGSSMGLTPDLSFFSKAVIMICMFIGRLGPVTIANLLVTGSEKAARYTEENVLIG